MIDYTCPHCGHILSIPDQFAGQRAQCKKCNNAIVVPANADAQTIPMLPASRKSMKIALASLIVVILIASGIAAGWLIANRSRDEGESAAIPIIPDTETTTQSAQSAAVEPASKTHEVVFARERDSDIRILSYRAPRLLVTQESAEPHRRIFQAIGPEIIAIQGLRFAVTERKLSAWLDEILPIEKGGWNVHFGLEGERGARMVLASVYPLSQPRQQLIAPIGDSYMTMAVIHPASADTSLYFLTLHLHSGQDKAAVRGRSEYSDAIAAWLADARQPGGRIELPDLTPMIVLGDFNFSESDSDRRAHEAILTGTIADTQRFGPSTPPDWDATALADLIMTDPYTGKSHTCCGGSRFQGLEVRFDRFYYTDSVLDVGRSFILNTQTMSKPGLAAAGLERMDTSSPLTSHHFPIIIDIRLK